MKCPACGNECRERFFCGCGRVYCYHCGFTDDDIEYSCAKCGLSWGFAANEPSLAWQQNRRKLAEDYLNDSEAEAYDLLTYSYFEGPVDILEPIRFPETLEVLAERGLSGNIFELSEDIN